MKMIQSLSDAFLFVLFWPFMIPWSLYIWLTMDRDRECCCHNNSECH